MNIRSKEPGPGRRKMEITCRLMGEVLFHKAGPSNIVRGLYRKWLETPKGKQFVLGLSCRSQIEMKEGEPA